MSTHQVSAEPFRWHGDGFDGGDFQISGRTLFFILALLSVILAVIILFFYARCVRRLVPPPPPASTPGHQLAATDPPPPPRGLDLATINNIPIVLYRNFAGSFSEAECCICLGIFGDKERVKVLPNCRHWFHSECVDEWLAARSSCPLCRAALRVDSPV